MERYRGDAQLAAEKEIFLREYIVNHAPDADLRELALDLLDGIREFRENINSTSLDESLEAWAAKAELELYKEKIPQVEMARKEIAAQTADEPEVTVAPTTPVTPRRWKIKAPTIWLVVAMAVVLGMALLWSLAVGCVVLVAYIVAWLMSVGEEQKQSPNKKGIS